MLQKYGNPEVACVTNTHPACAMGAIVSDANKHPGADSLRDAIASLSKTAWFPDTTDIASELGAPTLMNIVMMGALLGGVHVPVDADDLEAAARATWSEKRSAGCARRLRRIHERIDAGGLVRAVRLSPLPRHVRRGEASTGATGPVKRSEGAKAELHREATARGFLADNVRIAHFTFREEAPPPFNRVVDASPL